MMLGLFLREFKRGSQGLPAVSFGSKDQRIKGVKKTHRVLDDIIPAVGLSPWQGELPGTNLLDLWGFFCRKKSSSLSHGKEPIATETTTEFTGDCAAGLCSRTGQETDF